MPVVRNLFTRIGFAAAALWLSPGFSKAAPGDIDPSFYVNIGSDDVRAICHLPDGGTVIGGYFSEIGGTPQGGLAKLRPDDTHDPLFRPVLSGFNDNGQGSVSEIAVDSENRILIAGDFTHINGVPRRNFARLLPDGSVDATFNPAINDDVLSISLQPDGKILIGGEFTWVGGSPRRYLARLLSDGRIDSGFSPSLKERYPVTKVVALPDGKVIAANFEFTTTAGTIRKGIARFLSDGTLDTAFDTGLTTARADALTVQPDGKIIAGGWFVGSTPSIATELVRFNADGGLDGTFNATLEMSGYADGSYTVQSLALQEDGKVIIGGGFDKINGVSRSRVARLNANGSLDSSFASSATHWVHTLAILPSGKVLASQSTLPLQISPGNSSRFFRLDNTGATESLTFPTASSVSWNRGATSPFAQAVMFEKHTSSGAWEVLGYGTKSSTNWTLDAVSLPAEGVIRARAIPGQPGPHSISSQIGSPSPAVEIFDPSGNPVVDQQTLALPNAFPGTTSELRFSIRNPGDAILSPIAPSLSGTNPNDFSITPFPAEALCPDESRTFVIRFSPTSSGAKSATLTLTSSQPGLSGIELQLSGSAVDTLQPEFGELARTAVITDGFSATGKAAGTITLGFLPPKGTTLKLIDNRAIDHDPFATGHPIPLPISGMFTDLPDGSIIELPFGGQTYPFAVDYTGGDGNDLTLTLLGAGVVDPSFAIRPTTSSGPTSSASFFQFEAFLPDGRTIVAGGFTKIGGIERRGIARIKADGTVDPSFTFQGLFTSLHAIGVQSDGKVLISGASTEYSSGSGSVLVRLDTDGSLDKILTRDINNPITSIIVRDDGNLLVTGSFTSLGGFSRQGIALLDGEGGVITSFNALLNGSVQSAAIQSDGAMLIRGGFTTVASNPRSRLARLNADGSFDPGFAPVFTNEHWNSSPSFNDVLVLPDQKIMIAGSFHTVNGVSRHALVRLNPDGSVDESFEARPDDSVYSLFLLQDGSLLATGFRSADGILGAAARLLPDGTADASFALPYNGLPSTIAGVMRDGEILLKNGERLLGDAERSVLEIQPGPTIAWLRPEHAGDVTRPVFEVRTAGAGNWTPLGPAERIDGGWQIGSASLPANGAVRVTGCGSNGANPGSADQTHLTLGSDPPAIVIRKPDGSPADVSEPIPFGQTVPLTDIVLSVVVENTSASWIQGVSAEIPASPDFTLNGLSADSIPPFGSILANIRFTPQSTGTKVATFSIQNPSSGLSPSAGLQGEGGTAFSKTITSRNPSEILTDFNLAGLSLGDITLEFPPRNGQIITLLQSSGTQPLGEFTNLPDGSQITVPYKGHPFRFRVNYVNSGFRSVTLTPMGIISGISDFNAGLGSASATAIAIQRDGKIIVSGNFTLADGITHERIVRLNDDGSVDHAFAPAFSHVPDSIAVQSDGGILLAGPFTTVNGINRRGVSRLHPDGSLDESFDLGLTTDALRVVVMDDDRIYVSGPFLTIGGNTRPGIVRLLPDGTVDTTFSAGISSSTTSQIQAIQPMPDGKIIIGGTVRLTDGTLAYLRRLDSDGDIDPTFGSTPNSSVTSIALQKDGKILVGGAFTAIDGRGHGRIARLYPDGSVDKSFYSNLTANNTISGIALQSNGAVVIAGQFTQVTGQTQRAVARVLSNGEPDPGFLTTTSSSIIRAVALTESGEILAAGDFSSFHGVGRNGVVKIEVESGISDFGISEDQVIWNRSGSLPEFRSVVVEHSTDGADWVPVGNAVPYPDRWEWNGTSLPAGFVRARGFHSVSNRSSGTSQEIRLNGRTPTAIENWRQSVFGSPLNEGIGADNGDADADGSRNLVEYAFALNPLDPGSRLVPDWLRNGDHHEISLPHPEGITGILYDAEWSTSLAADEWYPAEDIGDQETLKFRVFSADKPNLFLRLKVIRP